MSVLEGVEFSEVASGTSRLNFGSVAPIGGGSRLADAVKEVNAL